MVDPSLAGYLKRAAEQARTAVGQRRQRRRAGVPVRTSGTFWAELTGEPEPGRYSWNQMTPGTTGTLTASGASGTGNAIENSAGAEGLPNGQIVRMFPQGTDGDGNAVFGFTLCLQNAGTFKLIGTEGEDTAARTDTWDRSEDAKKLSIPVLCRMAYDHSAATPRLYGYYRTWNYDALGHLISVSGETRVTIDEPEAC